MQNHNTAQIAQHVMQSLKDDKTDLQQMLACLHSERTALEQRTHDQLEKFASEKSALSQQLESRHTARLQQLNSIGHNNIEGSWRPLLQTLERQSGLPLSDMWDDIEQLLTECREVLQINEKIVGHLQNSVSQFINLLRSESGTPQTYGASGKVNAYTSGQSITTA